MHRFPPAFASRLLEHLPGMAFRCRNDEGWTLEEVSGGCRRLFGLEPEEMIGRALLDFVVPDDRSRLQSSGSPGLDLAQDGPRVFRNLGGEGAVRWLWWVGEACPATARGCEGLLLDVTSRVATQLKLEENEAFLRLSQEIARVGSWEWSLADGWVRWSDEMYRLHRIEPEEFDGTFEGALRWIHPEDRERVQEQAGRVGKAEEPPRGMEYRIVRPDGTVLPVFGWAEVVRDEEGTIRKLVGIVQDMGPQVEARRALEESEARFRTLIEHAPEGILLYDVGEGRFVEANPNAERFFGRGVEELLGLSPSDLSLEPQSDGRSAADRIETQIRQILSGETPVFEWDFVHRDGRTICAEVRLVLLPHPERELIRASVTDITERRLVDAERRKLSHAVAQTADAVMITDASGVIEYVNDAFVEVTGFERHEAIGRTPRIVRSGRHEPEFYGRLWETLNRGEVYRDVMINRRKGGELFYEEKTITPLKDAVGRITHFIATGKDITERMQSQERLHFLAHHDVLTRLPNRFLFRERLEHALPAARRHGRRLAVLFLDLDHFKVFNDTLGHAEGDRVLQLFAERLVEEVRGQDTVARLAGDEFIVLIEEVQRSGDIPEVAERILESIREPFLLDDREFVASTSIGIAVFPDDGEDVDTLLRHADTAMYRAKEQGRNRYRFYSSEMSASVEGRLQLQERLRRALAAGELFLLYQPIYDFGAGRIVECEALLRWRHPEEGVLAPARFVRLAEETGLISEIGDWVIRTVCARSRGWSEEGLTGVPISVNLSGRQFAEADLAPRILSLVESEGVAPEHLTLEMTESILMQDTVSTAETLRALHETGFGLALDDFGTGYSSLGYLKRFPIDSLKIDRSFVGDLEDDPSDAAIVEAVIAMAHACGARVVAEGVETKGQLAFLRDHDCDRIQGFLLSRPVPGERIPALLRDGVGGRIDPEH